MRILLTGGGTGGHLYPGLAIVDMLKREIPAEVLYVGTRHGLEAKVIPQTGYRFAKVWIAGFHRGELLRNLLFPLRMGWSFFQAILILLHFRPDIIMATGGYVCWPILSAGLILRRNLFLQEQNLKPGIVTRLFAPFARAVYLSFDASVPYYRKKSNLVISGNPTREALDHPRRTKAHCQFGLEAGKTTLFIFGGSQGSLLINRSMETIILQLVRKLSIQVLWAAGSRWVDEVKASTESISGRVAVFPYIEDMSTAYAISDLIVCRAGATTVAEITRTGKPSVLIPLASAAESHQMENARFLEKEGAACIIREHELGTGALEVALVELLRTPDRREKIGRRAKQLGRPDAAEKIVKDLIGRIIRADEKMKSSVGSS